MSSRFLPQAALGVVLAGTAAGCVRAPLRPSLAETPATTIALEPFADRRQAIAVVVAGDTLRFLFDTAGGVTALSPRLAERLGCAPNGRLTGYRMTGERLDLPTCDGVSLRVGPLDVRTDAVVLSLDGAFGPDAPRLDGLVSLQTLGHVPLTLDLARNTVTVETPQTLAARTRAMTPLRTRIATGPNGAERTPYVELTGPGGPLWFMLDSGHTGTAFVAPHAARRLGLADTTGGDATVALAPGLRVGVPLQGKADLIHDGVFGMPALERAVWTVDLPTARLWVGPVSPLFTPPTSATGTPSERWYDLTLFDRGQAQPVIVQVVEAPGGPTGRLRFVGDDRVYDLHDLRVDSDSLHFGLPMRRTYPFHVGFSGDAGSGTWGDAARGGRVEMRRR